MDHYVYYHQFKFIENLVIHFLILLKLFGVFKYASWRCRGETQNVFFWDFSNNAAYAPAWLKRSGQSRAKSGARTGMTDVNII